MQQQRGYSLVEVLIAMGIFGAIVISVMGLFAMGRRNVYSGKKMTEAVAVGTKVLEGLSGMPQSAIYTALKIDATTPLVTVTASDRRQYAASIRRSTDTIATSTESGYPNGLLSRWKTFIPATTMPDAMIEAIITPTVPNGDPVTTANFVKIRVFVNWVEEKRRRQIVFDMVRAQPL